MKIIRNDSYFTVTGFKRTNKYDYVAYTRNDEDGPRTYNVNDKKIPSVTSIIAKTQSADKKEALDKYGAEGSGKNLPFSTLSDKLKKKDKEKK